jgi:flagellin
MQINHNIRAMVTQHSMFTNNNAMSKSLEKLSTGLKINRAQDDAAGLAMSEQMRSQIRGLGKAKENSLNGIGALQIAEGGLAEITNLVQRQRELAIQSANDTLTDTERKYLNDEFQALTKEIGRIANSTDYNGKNMLVNGANTGRTANTAFGSTNTSYTLHVGPNYSLNGNAYYNEIPVTYTSIDATAGTGGSFSVSIAGVQVHGLNILTQKGATTAIDDLAKVLKDVSGARAAIGTYINRLEFTINNIANLEFNTQDAESRIRDTDFAKETTNFTRNQIMVQASVSMLSQANALPQAVLGLLG